MAVTFHRFSQRVCRPAITHAHADVNFGWSRNHVFIEDWSTPVVLRKDRHPMDLSLIIIIMANNDATMVITTQYTNYQHNNMLILLDNKPPNYYY